MEPLDFFLEILMLSWLFGGKDDEEHRGCGWAIFFGVLLLVLIGIVLWLVFRTR